MYGRVLFVFSLCLIFLISATACSKKKAADTPATDAEVTSTAPEPEPEPEVEEAVMETEPVEEIDMKIPVLEDVFFAYDSAKLSSDAKNMLQKNAKQLKDASQVDITVEGHCDERGTIAYNLALGEKRAKAAKDYIVSLGVPANRVKVLSYGKERPFDAGHNESAWKKNRRAHFVVSQN
jgi:peptidoglycan-associated lipoprotein